MIILQRRTAIAILSAAVRPVRRGGILLRRETGVARIGHDGITAVTAVRARFRGRNFRQARVVGDVVVIAVGRRVGQLIGRVGRQRQRRRIVEIIAQFAEIVLQAVVTTHAVGVERLIARGHVVAGRAGAAVQ